MRTGHTTGTGLRTLLLLLVLALAQAGVACRAAEQVFAVARLPLSLPVYVAEAQGYFADEKLALRIVDCQIGRECLDWLLGGNVHLATVADSPIVLASLRGAKFSVLATLATSRNYSKIVTRRDSGIRSPADLAGRRVGTFVGTSAQYFLDLTLLSAGIDPSQVALVPIEPSDAAHALASGRVDAVAVFEPFAFQSVRALGEQAHVLVDRRLRSETWNLVAAPGPHAQRDATLEAVCRALDRAAAFIGTQPQQARSIMRRRLGLDDAAVDWVWRDIEFGVALRQSLVTGLEAQARWALRNGHASGTPPNYLDYIRSDVLRQVRPGAASVVE